MAILTDPTASGALFLPSILEVTDAAGRRVNSFDRAEARPWGLVLAALLTFGVALATKTSTRTDVAGSAVGVANHPDHCR